MNQYQPLKIGNKTAALPIIQGGMGIGISLGGLAGAVAKEGAQESFPQRRLAFGSRISTTTLWRRISGQSIRSLRRRGSSLEAAWWASTSWSL